MTGVPITGKPLESTASCPAMWRSCRAMLEPNLLNLNSIIFFHNREWEALMVRRTSNSVTRFNGIAPSVWLGFFGVALVALAFIEYFETDRLLAGEVDAIPFILHLAGYANLLLVGSALLYVATTWFDSELTGRLASSLATVGAAAALVALAVRWVETYYLHRPGHHPLDGQFEILALFNAITVVAYLIMERVYRSRSAGAFVMLIVLAAVLFQAWLAAHDLSKVGHAVEVIRTYWMLAHVLSNFIGYAAFTAAAAMAVASLIRRAAGQRVAAGRQPNAAAGIQDLDRLMYYAVMLGFLAFTIGTILGAVWALQVWGRYWAWEIKEIWALAVWLPYASFLWLRHVHKWTGRRMEWWVIASFGIAVLCLIAAHYMGIASFSSAEPHVHINGKDGP